METYDNENENELFLVKQVEIWSNIAYNSQKKYCHDDNFVGKLHSSNLNLVGKDNINGKSKSNNFIPFSSEWYDHSFFLLIEVMHCMNSYTTSPKIQKEN